MAGGEEEGGNEKEQGGGEGERGRGEEGEKGRGGEGGTRGGTKWLARAPLCLTTI